MSFVKINGQKFQIEKINTFSPAILDQSQVKQSFDYRSFEMKPVYGFVIEMDAKDYQIGFDNKEEAEYWYQYLDEHTLVC